MHLDFFLSLPASRPSITQRSALIRVQVPRPVRIE